MAIDLAMFADKLQRYCRQFDVSPQDLSERTGISPDRLTALCNKQVEPTGDEILIFADYFKCDYKFFISNERLAPFEQTEKLFRKHGDVLTVQDKWAIQEFLFLCECQEFLLSQRQNGQSRRPFQFSKAGNFFKKIDICQLIFPVSTFTTSQIPAQCGMFFRPRRYIQGLVEPVWFSFARDLSSTSAYTNREHRPVSETWNCRTACGRPKTIHHSSSIL